MGGNLELTPDTEGTGVQNLHSIWDSVDYQFTGYETLPMDAATFEFYTTNAESINERYPMDMDKLKPAQFSAWAQESLDLAKSTVYDGFVPGEAPSQEYKDRALPAIETRIT